MTEPAITAETVPHHPHFISRTVTPTPWGGRVEWQFREFVGTEPDPEEAFPLPYETTRTWPADIADAAYDEQRAARTLWDAAVRIRGMHAGIRAAAPAWKAYQRARSAMEAAWEAIRDGKDGRFRANVLHLKETHEALLGAAREFDQAARAIPAAEYAQPWTERVLDRIPPLDKVAAQIGIDTTDWVVGDDYDYTDRYNDTPLMKQAREAIKDHDRRLRELADLIGTPASAEATSGW